MVFVKTGTRRAGIISLVFIAVLVSATGAPAETAWWHLNASRFQVLSEDSEKATRAWTEQFDQFLDSLGSTVNNDQGILPPLTVIMFRSDRNFKSFKPLKPNGEVDDNVVGFFSNSGIPNLIALSTGGRASYTLPTIYHEAVHWYVSPIRETLPLWFEEGLAELYSTFRIKSGKALWGEVIRENILLLRQSADLDLEELLALRRGDKLFNDSHKTSLFYARSWLFVHYLMFGDYEGPRDGLKKYLLGIQDRTRANAFHDAFNMDYPEMERTLKEYMRYGKYHYMAAPLSNEKHLQNLVTATPVIVHTELARLAYATRRTEELRQHAETLAAAAPETAVNYDVQTLLASRLKNPEQLNNAAQWAIALGSNDARTYLLLAGELERRYGREPEPFTPLNRLSPDLARQVADLCLSAIDINPTEAAPYRKLAWALLNVDQVTSDDAGVIRNGARLFQDEPELQLGLAIIEKQQGNLAAAVKLVRDVKTSLGGRSPVLRGMGHIIANVWVLDSYKGRIDSAVETHNFTEAFSLFDELKAYDLGPAFDNSMRDERERVELSERYYAAELAVREKRYAEARAILQEIKSMPGASVPVQRHVDEMIEYINQRDK